MEHPAPIEHFSPQVAKICGPGAPPQLKAMAAKGLAPLGPVDLTTVLYLFAFSADQALAKEAATSLSKLPEGILNGALEQLRDEQVLDGLARHSINRAVAMEKILLNKTAADETAQWIAKKSNNENVLELVASNEERLLRYPAIIESLYNNKTSRMSTVDRTVELAVRNGIELAGVASFAEVKAAIKGELILEPSEEPTPEDVVFRNNLEHDDWEKLEEEKVAEALKAEEEGVEGEADTVEKIESLRNSISKLTTSGKIRLATLGNANQRAVLIRDSNKLVSMAVVKAPSLKESEIMRYSRYRSLSEEVVRYMASNRDWTKQYQVKLNLVKNPRCPIEFSLRFLPHLRTTEVRSLERDKNVPQAIALAAKRLRNKRGR